MHIELKLKGVGLRLLVFLLSFCYPTYALVRHVSRKRIAIGINFLVFPFFAEGYQAWGAAIANEVEQPALIAPLRD